MTYEDALGEALCFGWIDSVIKKLDEQRYVRKFTPRTNVARWSSANLTRVQILIKDGRMTAAGLRKLKPGAAPQIRFSERRWAMPAFFTRALRKNRAAQRYFNQLAPSYKRAYIAWLATAKRPETRARRLKEAVALLEAGKKLGPK